MSFDITPTAAQHDLARRTHDFADKCVRPVALEYDQRQEFPWPVLEEAAERGFYSPLFYRDLIGDPTRSVAADVRDFSGGWIPSASFHAACAV
jgi:acyl-CoA dehydrogenase